MKVISINPLVVEHNGTEHTVIDNFRSTVEYKGIYDHSGTPGTYTGIHPLIARFIGCLNLSCGEQYLFDEVTKLYYYDDEYGDVESHYDAQTQVSTVIVHNPDDVVTLTEEEFARHEIDTANLILESEKEVIKMLEAHLDKLQDDAERETMIALKFAGGPILLDDGPICRFYKKDPEGALRYCEDCCDDPIVKFYYLKADAAMVKVHWKDDDDDNPVYIYRIYTLSEEIFFSDDSYETFEAAEAAINKWR